MALSPAQILDALLVLELPVRTDLAETLAHDGEALQRSKIARQLLETVDAAQEAKVIELLTAYADPALDADTLDTPDGLKSSPAKTRRLIARKMAQTIGLTTSVGGFRLERG